MGDYVQCELGPPGGVRVPGRKYGGKVTPRNKPHKEGTDT